METGLRVPLARFPLNQTISYVGPCNRSEKENRQETPEDAKHGERQQFSHRKASEENERNAGATDHHQQNGGQSRERHSSPHLPGATALEGVMARIHFLRHERLPTFTPGHCPKQEVTRNTGERSLGPEPATTCQVDAGWSRRIP